MRLEVGVYISQVIMPDTIKAKLQEYTVNFIIN